MDRPRKIENIVVRARERRATGASVMRSYDDLVLDTLNYLSDIYIGWSKRYESLRLKRPRDFYARMVRIQAITDSVRATYKMVEDCASKESRDWARRHMNGEEQTGAPSPNM